VTQSPHPSRSIVFVNSNPRQLLPHQRELIAAPRVLLLRREQFEPLREPLVARSYYMLTFCRRLIHHEVLHNDPLDRP
jgi:hypothetical protein